jgi:hypothetical protein
MSEFECVNGHLFGGGSCPVCGDNPVTMDGKSSRQLAAEEAYEPDEEELDCDDEFYDYDEETEDEED